MLLIHRDHVLHLLGFIVDKGDGRTMLRHVDLVGTLRRGAHITVWHVCGRDWTLNWKRSAVVWWLFYHFNQLFGNDIRSLVVVWRSLHLFLVYDEFLDIWLFVEEVLVLVFAVFGFLHLVMSIPWTPLKRLWLISFLNLFSLILSLIDYEEIWSLVHYFLVFRLLIRLMWLLIGRSFVLHDWDQTAHTTILTAQLDITLFHRWTLLLLRWSKRTVEFRFVNMLWLN